MRRSVLPEPSRKADLDVSLAIVNIVLLLILFFLGTGQLLNSPSYGTDLSQTTDLNIDNLPRPILVIEADGSFLLDGEPVATELLATAIDGQVLMHILIDRNAPASDLLKLLARPEMATLEIKLVTIHKQPEGDGS